MLATSVRTYRLAVSKELTPTILTAFIPGSSREISTASFSPPNVYSTNAVEFNAVLRDVQAHAAYSGADAAGADSAKIFGGRHQSSTSWSHLTVAYFNKQGQKMYFFNKTDNKFYDRVHVDTQNGPHWPKQNELVGITYSQFAQKLKPAGV